MVEKDYVMRITHEMVRMWLKLLFHIDEEKEEEIVFETGESEDLYQRLCLLVKDKKINEAENLLYERLESPGAESREKENLKVSLYFYDYLNEKSDQFLEECDFSRQEIQEGVVNVMRRNGYGDLAQAWGEGW